MFIYFFWPKLQQLCIDHNFPNFSHPLCIHCRYLFPITKSIFDVFLQLDMGIISRQVWSCGKICTAALTSCAIDAGFCLSTLWTKLCVDPRTESFVIVESFKNIFFQQRGESFWIYTINVDHMQSVDMLKPSKFQFPYPYRLRSSIQQQHNPLSLPWWKKLSRFSSIICIRQNRQLGFVQSLYFNMRGKGWRWKGSHHSKVCTPEEVSFNASNFSFFLNVAESYEVIWGALKFIWLHLLEAHCANSTELNINFCFSALTGHINSQQI